MDVKTVVVAAQSIQTLIEQDLPIRVAWDLKKLMDMCNPVLEFYGQELEKSAFIKGSGEKRKDLLSLELPEFDCFDPIRLPLDMPIKLSAGDCKRLEPFVTFEEV